MVLPLRHQAQVLMLRCEMPAHAAYKAAAAAPATADATRCQDLPRPPFDLRFLVDLPANTIVPHSAAPCFPQAPLRAKCPRPCPSAKAAAASGNHGWWQGPRGMLPSWLTARWSAFLLAWKAWRSAAPRTVRCWHGRGCAMGVAGVGKYPLCRQSPFPLPRICICARAGHKSLNATKAFPSGSVLCEFGATVGPGGWVVARNWTPRPCPAVKPWHALAHLHFHCRASGSVFQPAVSCCCCCCSCALQLTLTAPNYLSVQTGSKTHIILSPETLQVRVHPFAFACDPGIRNLQEMSLTAGDESDRRKKGR